MYENLCALFQHSALNYAHGIAIISLGKTMHGCPEPFPGRPLRVRYLEV